MTYPHHGSPHNTSSDQEITSYPKKCVSGAMLMKFTVLSMSTTTLHQLTWSNSELAFWRPRCSTSWVTISHRTGTSFSRREKHGTVSPKPRMCGSNNQGIEMRMQATVCPGIWSDILGVFVRVFLAEINNLNWLTEWGRFPFLMWVSLIQLVEGLHETKMLTFTQVREIFFPANLKFYMLYIHTYVCIYIYIYTQRYD
jgi:hypothetical protein